MIGVMRHADRVHVRAPAVLAHELAWLSAAFPSPGLWQDSPHGMDGTPDALAANLELRRRTETAFADRDVTSSAVLDRWQQVSGPDWFSDSLTLAEAEAVSSWCNRVYGSVRAGELAAAGCDATPGQGDGLAQLLGDSDASALAPMSAPVALLGLLATLLAQALVVTQTA